MEEEQLGKNLMSYKYSIVIPVRDGLKTLANTLPKILEISKNREDVEIIVCDNNSKDDLEDWIKNLKSNNLFFYQTKKDLKSGQSLDFALSKATGNYISYIGDDDQIFNNRFDILDHILNDNPDTDLFIGKIVRCNLYKNKYINNIQFDNYSGKISFLNKTESHNYLNKVSINAGGSFVISKSIYKIIYEKFGFYSSDIGVEFFILRSALFLSKKAVSIDLPFLLMGRSDNSAGSIGFENDVNKVKNRRWNVNFEYNNSLNNSLINYVGYIPISFDSSILVATVMNKKKLISYNSWVRYTIAELFLLQSKRKISLINCFRIFINSNFFIGNKIYGFLYFIFFFLRKNLIKKNKNGRHSYSIILKKNVNINDLMSVSDFSSYS